MTSGHTSSRTPAMGGVDSRASNAAGSDRNIWVRSLRSRPDGGFTLLEVMIVLAIIGLIAGSIGVAVFGQFKKGQEKTAKLNVREIATATEQYMIENNNECPKGLEDLVAKKNLRKVIKDPWGRDFVLKCPGQNGDGADVISYGPNKEEGGGDDINSSEL